MIMSEKNSEGKVDIELLVHKYSDFFSGFVRYDIRKIDYPVYRTKISYLITKEQKVHPIVVSILKIIQYLEKLADCDVYSYLKQVTQLEDSILNNILADITTKGYLKQDETLKLSSNGEEILEKESERIVESACDYINFDGIYGKVLHDDGRYNQGDKTRRKDAIEFKPYVKTRPRLECLDEIFSDNKTLRQVIIENLKRKCDDTEDVTDIQQIDTNKFFNRYYCLFYKDSEETVKLLVIDDNYEIDADTTELFDILFNDQKFEERIAPDSIPVFNQASDEFDKITSEIIEERLKPVEPINFENGKTIEVEEHKKYFIYVLEHAKNFIYIQSPWIKWRTLQIYKEYIESAISRGVKVIIKYGMKPRNIFDKVGIDKPSRDFFDSLDKKYFQSIEDNDHSKIIICDDEFMIVGSFNWLSFGGGNVSNARGETSSINLNKDEIKKQIEKFRSPKTMN